MFTSPVENGMPNKAPDLPFSDLTKRLAKPTSNVWAVHYEALARQQAGEDVLLLSVGDPDFDTPPYISKHVIEQINRGRTHYSPAAGEPKLRQEIAKLETRNVGYAIDPDQVVVFPGGTATLYATLACILNTGDGLVVAEPMYVGYQGIAESIGIELQFAPLKQPNFDLCVQTVKDQIKANTRAVLLNTPGNPCGNIIPPAVLTELATFCAEQGLWLICDEVYSLITYEQAHTSMLNCTNDLSNVVVIDGLSKSHAMSGWRVGWAVTCAPMAQALIRFSGAAFFGTSQFVQDAAAFALANDAQDVERMRSQYQQRRDYVVSRVNQIEGLSLSTPKGGMFVMLDISKVSASGEAFSRGLLDDEGIAVLPGSCFGPSGNNYVRCSLTEGVPVLAKAMDRISRYCAAQA